MGMLQELSDDKIWRKCLNHKLEKGHMYKGDERFWTEFIDNKQYLRITKALEEDRYTFDYPIKKYVNKVDSNKKRVVYTFKENETMVLKLMSYLMYRYDLFLSDNLYSFRKNQSPKTAIRRITTINNIDNMYCYKVDVSNYFNSINIDKLLPILKDMVSDDRQLYMCLQQVLTQNKAYIDGEVICENRGVMAGIPISPFLANIYLKEMDEYFFNNNITYARYSDDIICFADSRIQLNSYINIIASFLDKYDLKINTDKEAVVNPHEKWEFLGVSYVDGKIDLSDGTIMKMKGKIRRKARALYRWKNKKSVSNDHAMKAMIKVYNRKFYNEGQTNESELTWSRWFFPLINTDEGLKIIDEYLQQNIRYITTGKHSKINYKVTYDKLKKLGYRCLVGEYYRKINEKNCTLLDNSNKIKK